jgi:hypothetical protein
MTKERGKNAGNTGGKPFAIGNPGRPKGSLNKTTLAVQSLLDGQAQALTQKAIGLALEGDMMAIRICLDRIIPIRKSRPISINLPDTKNASGIAEAQAAVVQAVGAGLIVPDEGQVLSSILEARRKALETQDHEVRLNKLEELEK